MDRKRFALTQISHRKSSHGKLVVKCWFCWTYWLYWLSFFFFFYMQESLHLHGCQSSSLLFCQLKKTKTKTGKLSLCSWMERVGWWVSTWEHDDSQRASLAHRACFSKLTKPWKMNDFQVSTAYWMKSPKIPLVQYSIWFSSAFNTCAYKPCVLANFLPQVKVRSSTVWEDSSP